MVKNPLKGGGDKEDPELSESDSVTAHILTPGGRVREEEVGEHNRFEFDEGNYDVRNIFSFDNLGRMMLLSKGNPIPYPPGGATTCEAMGGQYVSATIEDISRPSRSGGDIFDMIVEKVARIPPWVGVIILVVLILWSQGVIG